ncbi:hypothetical protein RAC83_000948 [Xylella fastidiosa]|nr:hypothetical protein [Xylella fastidiosa]
MKMCNRSLPIDRILLPVRGNTAMLAVCCQVQQHVADSVMPIDRMGASATTACMDVRVCGFCGGSR